MTTNSEKKQASEARELTRACAAKILGCSISKLRTIEGSRLHPIKRDGVYYFDEREVRELADAWEVERKENPTTKGARAALAHELFSEGHFLRDIVLKLKAEPEEIYQHYDEFMKIDGRTLSQHAKFLAASLRRDERRWLEEERLAKQEADEHLKWRRELWDVS